MCSSSLSVYLKDLIPYKYEIKVSHECKRVLVNYKVFFQGINNKVCGNMALLYEIGRFYIQKSLEIRCLFGLI